MRKTAYVLGFLLLLLGVDYFAYPVFAQDGGGKRVIEAKTTLQAPLRVDLDISPTTEQIKGIVGGGAIEEIMVDASQIKISLKTKENAQVWQQVFPWEEAFFAEEEVKIPFDIAFDKELWGGNYIFSVLVQDSAGRGVARAQREVALEGDRPEYLLANMEIKKDTTQQVVQVSFDFQNGETTQTVRPRVRLFERKLEGAFLSAQVGETAKLSKGEKGTFVVEIPIPEEPELYMVQAAVIDSSGKELGGFLTEKFFIEGEFGEIDTFRFVPKEFETLLPGEQIEFFLEGFVTRGGDELELDIQVLQELDGKEVDTFKTKRSFVLDGNNRFAEQVSFVLNQSATRFVMQVRIERGKEVLEEKVFQTSLGKGRGPRISSSDDSHLINTGVIIFLGVVLVLFLMWTLIHHKKSDDGGNSFPPSMMIFILVLSVSFFGGSAFAAATGQCVGGDTPAIGATGLEYNDSTSGPIDKEWVYTSGTPGPCQWTCSSFYNKDGGTCVPEILDCNDGDVSEPTTGVGLWKKNGTYTYTGTVKEWTYVEEANGEGDLSICEWACDKDSYYERDGNKCKLQVKPCGGTDPTGGAGVITGQNFAEGAPRNWRFVEPQNTDDDGSYMEPLPSPGACEWTCNTGYVGISTNKKYCVNYDPSYIATVSVSSGGRAYYSLNPSNAVGVPDPSNFSKVTFSGTITDQYSEMMDFFDGNFDRVYVVFPASGTIEWENVQDFEYMKEFTDIADDSTPSDASDYRFTVDLGDIFLPKNNGEQTVQFFFVRGSEVVTIDPTTIRLDSTPPSAIGFEISKYVDGTRVVLGDDMFTNQEIRTSVNCSDDLAGCNIGSASYGIRGNFCDGEMAGGVTCPKERPIFHLCDTALNCTGPITGEDFDIKHYDIAPMDISDELLVSLPEGTVLTDPDEGFSKNYFAAADEYDVEWGMEDPGTVLDPGLDTNACGDRDGVDATTDGPFRFDSITKECRDRSLPCRNEDGSNCTPGEHRILCDPLAPENTVYNDRGGIDSPVLTVQTCPTEWYDSTQDYPTDCSGAWTPAPPSPMPVTMYMSSSDYSAAGNEEQKSTLMCTFRCATGYTWVEDATAEFGGECVSDGTLEGCWTIFPFPFPCRLMGP